MKVTERDLAKCPEITPILDRALTAKFGIGVSNERVIGYLRFSTDPQAIALVGCYDELGETDRSLVPVEAICIAAGVQAPAILGLAIMCARQVSAQEAALTTILEHPDVTKATIGFAKTLPGATKDREMVHQAVGWLPTSKGNSVNVNLFGGNPQLTSTTDDDDDGDDDDSAFGRAFPSLNAHVEKWGDQRRKLLDKGK